MLNVNIEICVRYRNIQLNVTGIYKNIDISCQFQIIIISITLKNTLY